VLDATEHGRTLPKRGLAQPRPPDRCAGISTVDAASPNAPSANAEGLGVPGPDGVRCAGQISSIGFAVLGERFVIPASGPLDSMLG
jgi:hypothetical protein